MNCSFDLIKIITTFNQLCTVSVQDDMDLNDMSTKNSSLTEPLLGSVDTNKQKNNAPEMIKMKNTEHPLFLNFHPTF